MKYLLKNMDFGLKQSLFERKSDSESIKVSMKIMSSLIKRPLLVNMSVTREPNFVNQLLESNEFFTSLKSYII